MVEWEEFLHVVILTGYMCNMWRVNSSSGSNFDKNNGSYLNKEKINDITVTENLSYSFKE